MLFLDAALMELEAGEKGMVQLVVLRDLPPKGGRGSGVLHTDWDPTDTFVFCWDFQMSFFWEPTAFVSLNSNSMAIGTL